MSIRLMSIAWKAPDLNPGQKLVLIALCDNASDEGICYPAIKTLAMKCSMGERTVTRHITDFEALGFVTREERPGRSTFYTINPRQFGTTHQADTPANLAPHPANLASTTNNEEPSPNHQVISPLKTKAGKEKTSIPACPRAEIIGLYHDKLPTLPRVRLTTKARERTTASFWAFVMTSKREDGSRRADTTDAGLEWVGQYFDQANANDFLMGRNRSSGGAHANWRCDFDFLLSERGMKHVIEKTQTE